jgi:ribA/ribD-fused uncharacterized protein
MSNFYRAPFISKENGIELKWRNSEQYFQAHKFPFGSASFTEVYNSTTPREAADLGRSLSGLKEDWDAIKNSVMDHVLYLKFTQNPKLMEKLLATGNEEIIEASPTDAYWGWGPDHKGRNQLGKCLMSLREKLRNE